MAGQRAGGRHDGHGGGWAGSLAVAMLLGLLPGLVAAESDAGTGSPPAVDDTVPVDDAAQARSGLEAIPPLSEDDYLETRNCLFLRRVDKTRVPDTDRILFYERGGDVWMSQLKRACHGLADDRSLWFDVHGSKVCQSDRVVVTDRFTDGVVMGNCILGPFERVTLAQAEALMAQPPRPKRPGLLQRLFRRDDGGSREDE